MNSTDALPTRKFPLPAPEALDPAVRKALECLPGGALAVTEPAYADAVEQLAVDSLKCLIVDAVEHANSGHPGGPLSSIDFVWVLFTEHLKISPDAGWLDRDRFVLSGGHMSMLLYSFLHMTGRLSMDDLKAFRQLGSLTQGHPVHRLCPGVETSTGPLGQGFGNAVGMAIAERLLGSAFGSDLVDHHTYVVATDGDFQEGVCHEAAAVAGLLGLDKLVVFYDSNGIQLASPTSKTMHEDTGAIFAAMGWNVLDVADGHDRPALSKALAQARETRGKPTLIVGHTKIAHGTRKENSVESHGMPLGADVIREFKENLGHPADQTFWLPRFVHDFFTARLEAGKSAQAAWAERLAGWRKASPGRAGEWDLCFSDPGQKQLSERARAAYERIDFSSKQVMSTRAASGTVMAALAKTVPTLAGGSADLANSTKTDGFEKAAGYIIDGLAPGTWRGRGIHFGVREHGMGAIANGIAYHGGLRPYTGTFLAFSDYMRGAIRLAAISKLPVTFIFTHDSIFLGEDGETHQPIEQLAALRAIPRMMVLRPGDAHECIHAWHLILSRAPEEGPACLILTRQDLPILQATRYRYDAFAKGAYVVHGEEVRKPDIQFLASGSELGLAVEAARQLDQKHGKKARVISVPCLELFLRQPQAARDAVLLPGVPLRLSIEAGTTQGWKALTGDLGHEFGLDEFGESGTLEALAAKHGFLPGPLAEKAAELIAQYPERAREAAERLCTD